MFSKATKAVLTLALAVATLGLIATFLPIRALAGSREKVIDFEDALVEGVNRKPYDSLQALSEKERRKRRSHLYHRRLSFQSEIEETLRERALEHDGS
jgi:hypothetical protein